MGWKGENQFVSCPLLESRRSMSLYAAGAAAMRAALWRGGVRRLVASTASARASDGSGSVELVVVEDDGTKRTVQAPV
jgi:hypothetical protein